MTRLTEALEDHGRSSVRLLNHRADFFGLLAMLLVSATHVGMAAAQATFPVNSTGDGADSNTGDAICDDRTGNCTLQVAIRRANASAGTDNIFFSTPVETDPGCVTATGVCTVQPGSAQPTIGPVMIDGYTKPRASPNTNGPRLGSNGALKIELHGSSQSQGSGLVIASGNTTVRALVVNRTASRGLGEIGDSLAINALSTLSIPRAWATFPGENGRIVFSRDFGVDLLTMNPDGSDQTRIAAGFVPTWSSDGTEIAFDKAENGNRDIYTMNADGTNESRITTDPLSDGSPTWSPNGMRIAFNRNLTAQDNQQLFVINADGTGETRLTYTARSDMNAHWSPNGSQLVFQSNRDGNWEIYVMNANGTGQTRLTFTPERDTWPDWSPDGTEIAFLSDRDGNTEIYVMKSDGAGQSRLTDNPARDEIPTWSPDGTKIAFRSDRDGNFEIYTMNADGSNQINITNHPGNDGFPDWQPTKPAECLHFEDLLVGTIYPYGDAFSTAGSTIDVESFFWGDGTETTSGRVRVQNSGLAGGSANELAIDNVNIDFNIGAALPHLSLLFGEYGGNLNIEINGEFRNFNNFIDIDGQTIGGVIVSVVNGLGDDRGSLTLEGTINSFKIGGQELFIDAVCPSALIPDLRRGLSIHFGMAQPFGHLGNSTDLGPTLNLDLVFPITQQLAWDLRLGYSLFYGSGAASDVDIWNLSANLKYRLAPSTPWPFINGGVGLYYVDGRDLEGGYNLGFGSGFPIGPNLIGEVTFNYHSTVTASPDYRFGKVQAGIIWFF